MIAKAAAKAAYETAQQELILIQQAASNASARLVNVSNVALAAGERMDMAQLAAAEAAQKVGPVPVTWLTLKRNQRLGAWLSFV